MKLSRRKLLTASAAVASSAVLLGSSNAEASRHKNWETSYSGVTHKGKAKRPGMPGKDYTPVTTLNGAALPFKIVNGVKVFHLVAEELENEFAPGLNVTMWGYNGRTNATTIEAVEGDHIRIYVTNTLEVPTTVHWHGLFLPNGMDGVSKLTQRPIKPGETFKYEFVLRQHGTYMYHSHHDTMTQEGMGLIGMFIVHPRKPRREDRVDRDFAVLLAEYRVDAGTSRPNPFEMTDFNILTMNGKCFPGIEPFVVKTGDRVRIRIGNLSAMDHHPIHLHGHYFKITATDGNRIPASAQWPETTVLVSVGQTRDIELVADAPGDWAMHCHMTHHVMNQMGHGFPNMIGMKAGDLARKVRQLLPGYMTMGETGMGDMMMSMPMPDNSIAMKTTDIAFGATTVGGMFTVFKVRDKLKSYDQDPGWYQHPEGTMADLASAADLKKDGIDPGSWINRKEDQA